MYTKREIIHALKDLIKRIIKTVGKYKQLYCSIKRDLSYNWIYLYNVILCSPLNYEVIRYLLIWEETDDILINAKSI
jgi:hypothetical protein